MTAHERITSFPDLAAYPRGHVFADRFEDGVRFLIMRGGGSLTAYLGIPSEHPLAGFQYNDLPLECHGGLTFSEAGSGKERPAGFWWYGWDYAHFGDRSFYDLKYPWEADAKEWTVEEVEADAKQTIEGFKALARLAERIASKAKLAVGS